MRKSHKRTPRDAAKRDKYPDKGSSFAILIVCIVCLLLTRLWALLLDLTTLIDKFAQRIRWDNVFPLLTGSEDVLRGAATAFECVGGGKFFGPHTFSLSSQRDLACVSGRLDHRAKSSAGCVHEPMDEFL